MKLLAVALRFCCSLALCDGSKVDRIQIPSKDLSQLTDAVNGIMSSAFTKEITTINLIVPETSEKLNELQDFKSELLSKNFLTRTHHVVVRQDTANHIATIPGRRKRCSIFIVASDGDFRDIYGKITANIFTLHGTFLIVFVDDHDPDLKAIFTLLWNLQIHNVAIIYQNAIGKVLFDTFLPFNQLKCNDTTPITVNEWANGKFINGVENLYPDKMRNLQGCPIRLSVSNRSEPYIFVKSLENGTFTFRGRDIKLIDALSKTLNFEISYSYVGNRGYLVEQGVSQNPLSAVSENLADISLGNWWLKMSRLKLLDGLSAYYSDQVIFMVPPGRKFSAFGQLAFAFSSTVWGLIFLCFLVGFATIFILRSQSRQICSFLYGSGVQSPALNMFVGFMGGSQRVLPKRNFARFLLMLFLMYSLVMRTLYQGSYFQLLQGSGRHKQIQSVDEMIAADYKFIIWRALDELFAENEALKKRLSHSALSAVTTLP
jgi:hypothetical protein